MWFRLLIIQFCLPFAAFAQSSAPPKMPYQLRLLCVEATQGAENLLVMEKVDDAWTPRWRLKVSSNFLTDPLGFAGPNLGIAIDPSPPANSGPFNGPPVPVKEKIEGIKPFCELKITRATGTGIMVANTGEEKKTVPYRVFLFDTDRTNFGPGRILIQNFAPTQVAGVIGGIRVIVSPGKSEIVEPGADQPADMAQITLASKETEGLRVFCDTRWPAKTDYRRYLLILPRADGSLQPFVFPEYPPFP